jgi:branched-chain amino acid transport system permease protein
VPDDRLFDRRAAEEQRRRVRVRVENDALAGPIEQAHLGGSDGKYIYVRPALELAGWRPFDLENPAHFYYLVLGLMLFVFASLRVLLASPFGRVVVALRENEHRLRMLGYATFRYKLVCFVLAGMLAGLAGWLAAAHDGLVNPEALELVLQGWTKHWQLLLGGFIVLSVLFMPRGLAQLFEWKARSAPKA